MATQATVALSQKAKQYSRIKYTLSITETVYTLILLLVFLSLGMAKILGQGLSGFLAHTWLVLPVYLLVISLLYYLLDFPFNFYHSYILEHRFSLSQQKISNWLADQLKSGIIAYLLGLIILSVFYYLVGYSPNYWWLIISLFWIFFTIVLAKLTPTVIIPLFFKYRKLTDENLRQKILALADKMGVKILDCFEIDFSKKTLKANAAFVGVGKTRRVILADTLKDKYSDEEIEVILAHEFAHYRLKHLLKLIFCNSLVTLVLFYLIFKTSGLFLHSLGLSSLTEISGLPLILLYFILFGTITQPLENLISRRFEKDADKMALSVTGLKAAFISTMDKLANQNLADRNPHPLIKFFFFDHPSIDERIAIANTFQK